MKINAQVIEGFCNSVLVKNFDSPQPTPECHREWWELCCSDDKYVAIAAPRGHAKSTAVTHTFGLASVLFRESVFVIIVSDTEGQAVLFLNDIKKELTENEDIVSLFEIEKLEKDQETDIIVRCKDGHRFRIMAKGSEQKVRGLKWRGKRPDLILCDDLENDEIVMNPERRTKFRRWVTGALLPCLSDDGRIRIVGTILHIDSYLENRMPKLQSRNTVVEPLKTWNKNKIGMWRSVKYRAHTGPNDFTSILWPEKFSESRLRSIRDGYIADGHADLYYQEYLNYPIDESRAMFKRSDLIPMEDDKYILMRQKKLPVLYFVGFDMAVTKTTTADWTVFVVVAIDSENMMYVIDVVRARMDALQIVNTIFELEEKYHPEWFAGEKGLIDHAIAPFLEEQMFTRSRFPTLERLTRNTDKELFAKPIAGRVRIHGVRFLRDDNWYPDFEAELIEFPRGKHDDQVDAFANIGQALTKLVVAPTAQEQEEEDEEEEKRRVGYHDDDGRSMTTGY